MARLMSFALTTAQVLARQKTVTRRHGWKGLQPGTVLCAVEKGMGLRKGESVRRLAQIRVVSVRREPLRLMLDDLDYGLAEVAREGFTDHPLVLGSPHAFVDFYRNAHPASTRPDIDDDVTRVEFEYLPAANPGE